MLKVRACSCCVLSAHTCSGAVQLACLCSVHVWIKDTCVHLACWLGAYMRSGVCMQLTCARCVQLACVHSVQTCSGSMHAVSMCTLSTRMLSVPLLALHTCAQGARVHLACVRSGHMHLHACLPVAELCSRRVLSCTPCSPGVSPSLGWAPIGVQGDPPPTSPHSSCCPSPVLWPWMAPGSSASTRPHPCPTSPWGCRPPSPSPTPTSM